MLSTNPIYTLMLNGFAGFYEDMARLYFSLAESRTESRRFYAALREAASMADAAAARALVEQVMETSIELWNRASAGQGWPPEEA